MLALEAFRDFVLQDLTDSVAHITQCTSFSGAAGGCDTSLFRFLMLLGLRLRGVWLLGIWRSCSAVGPLPAPVYGSANSIA